MPPSTHSDSPATLVTVGLAGLAEVCTLVYLNLSPNSDVTTVSELVSRSIGAVGGRCVAR